MNAWKFHRFRRGAARRRAPRRFPHAARFSWSEPCGTSSVL